MKAGTKIGWLLVAIALILSVWVIVSQSNKAASDGTGYETDDSGTLVAIPAGSTGSITIPSTIDTDTVTAISDGLFNDDITAITLPSTLTSVSPSNFDSATSLASLAISGSSTYHTYDGCLYQGTTLVYVPQGKSTVNIESGTTAIGADAFLNSTLTTLSIPTSVTSIGAQTNSWTDSNFKVYAESDSYADGWATGLGYEVIYGGGSSTTTYNITYNPGTGASGTAMTDTYEDGDVATLRTAATTTGFTRTGYTISGWNTAADGSGTAYALGASYTVNGNLNLYAQWSESGGGTTGYTITYNPGTGASGSVITDTYPGGSSITLRTAAAAT
ncbi:MAG: InlB B-repeat-containing protein, partial [Lachnospiraceae bacterium]|nr:InlB B-repeat-containing protein [Lachnospiraceae bacterium]